LPVHHSSLAPANPGVGTGWAWGGGRRGGYLACVFGAAALLSLCMCAVVSMSSVALLEADAPRGRGAVAAWAPGSGSSGGAEGFAGVACEGGSAKRLRGPVFVVGCGHSGTTMMHRLVSQVPGVLGVGNTLTCGVCVETGIFVHPEYGVTCETGCSETCGCSAKAAAAVALEVADDGVVSIPAYAGVYCNETKQLGKVSPATAMAGWDRLTCASADHTRWLEKTPKHVASLALIWEERPDARVVHVVRDGRDVALSIQRRMIAIDRPRGDTASDQAFLVRAATRWVKDNRAALAFEQDPRMLILKLEDLSMDPAPDVTRLLEFLGEPAGASDVARVIRRMNAVEGHGEAKRGPEEDTLHVVPAPYRAMEEGAEGERLDIGDLRKRQISAGLGGLAHVPVTLTAEQADAMASVPGFVDLLVLFGYAPGPEAWH